MGVRDRRKPAAQGGSLTYGHGTVSLDSSYCPEPQRGQGGTICPFFRLIWKPHCEHLYRPSLGDCCRLEM